MILTKHLQLLPCTLQHFELFLQGSDVLANHLGISISENWIEYPEVILVTYDKLRNDPTLLGWFFYMVIHQEKRELIGAGGFKGKPDANGIVEIAYEISPEHREQGLGTEMAQALINFAFGHSYVKSVIAHTEEEYNASVKILQKIGMSFAGAMKNKDDEALWEWKITREQFEKDLVLHAAERPEQ
ncbi:MAG: GNAT family N-acetyltransferase [Chitinophaga sp.]|uniref:GNAT family N-acetyltransferase n=1 Tax=Chitinophaga sp. TaxID=1869181 RepID=UPI0025B851ED|nr:GNAT family N-acetyltransferase [Chitinophaga sp.]MBV8254690.1 GNAT family N-acetyltransferase [Chitinophaga sp.]